MQRFNGASERVIFVPWTMKKPADVNQWAFLRWFLKENANKPISYLHFEDEMNTKPKPKRWVWIFPQI